MCYNPILFILEGNMSITVKDFFDKVNSYNSESFAPVRRAYELAYELHKGQYRQSGEEYITHPLIVAYILADMYVDCDTLCAALLHDAVEDTNITLDEIRELFNDDVAMLVDGVTKISKLNFSSRSDENDANIRKIVTSITKDIRIIIIKLADRLHNMRTLEYKSREKQLENAHETMDLYVNLAYYIGAYKIKNELEDLSFKYINNNEYNRVLQKREKIIHDNKDVLNVMRSDIKRNLSDVGILGTNSVSYRNVYSIYKKLLSGDNINFIHDLMALNFILDNKLDCYTALGVVHELYLPINDKFRDFISRPKTNMYSALHTSVFAPNNSLVQIKIKTNAMDKINNNGICAYWDMYRGKARVLMQRDIERKYQFFNSLVQINNMFPNNKDFAEKISDELLTDKVYVYTANGEIVELPLGSSIIDFIYKVTNNFDNSVCAALVNNTLVNLNYILKNNDRVILINNKYLGGPDISWEDFAKTSYAKEKIREYNKLK